MPREKYDVVVLGAGFAGSLLAILAQKLGLRTALLERATHPRFAIGESSTPLANLKLLSLAETYDLPWLRPLSKYGPWKRTHPTIGCGLKRGFSFFHHQLGREFVPSTRHENELLVEANPDTDHGDTHWYRADFDALLVKKAQAQGVFYAEQCRLSHLEHENGWRLQGTSRQGPIELQASFAFDATGPANRLGRALGLQPTVEGVRCCSRALFGHFRDVMPWEQVLAERSANTRDHPFPCDAAALHHVFEGGWMWVLRFDHGVTSAGFSLDPACYPVAPAVSPEQEWRQRLAAFPSLQRQFSRATVVEPIVQTGRLQRRLPRAVGEDWAILPHAACFLDPWLSPGIAHTLFGVERLAHILAESWSSPDRSHRLASYSRTLFAELDVMDQITAACYARFDCFPIVAALTMLYFVAVIFSEERLRAGKATSEEAFLLAHDPDFRSIVREVCARAPSVAAKDAEAWAATVRRQIAPYNTVGLCDPARHNMYPFGLPPIYVPVVMRVCP